MEDEEEGVLTECPRNGTKSWFDKKGRYHRIGGPAFVHKNGDCSWYIHGELHRDAGPAREWPSEGIEEWYKDGIRYEPSAHELMVWKMKKKEC